MTLTPPQTSPPLQNHLTAPVASFARQCNYGYVSLQELATGTRQLLFRFGGEV